jgi:O-antigen/teichoic acid export membrane protein
LAIAGGVAKIGLDGILVRELVNNKKELESYLGTAFWLRIIASVLVFISVVTVMSFFNNDMNIRIFISIITIGLLFQSYEIVDFYFQSQVLAKHSAISKVIQLMISTVTRVLLIGGGYELLWFAVATLFDAMTLALIFYIKFKLNDNKLSLFCFEKKIAIKLLRDSYPFMLSIVSFIIYLQLDSIMIGGIMGSYYVGLYAASLKITSAHFFISTIIVVSIFPALLEIKEFSAKEYKRRIGQIFSFLFYLNLIVAVILYFLADIFIAKLYGDDFATSSSLIILQSCSIIFASIGFFYQQILIGENKGGVALYRSIFGLVINFILNYTLIPIYGLVGAALALLISQIISNYIIDYFDKNTREYFYIKSNSMFKPWLNIRKINLPLWLGGKNDI